MMLCVLLTSVLAGSALVGTGQIAPCPPLPEPRQIARAKMRRIAFCHFGPNTFSGEEWGHGNEDPNLFNPKDLDCRQWARTLKNAGCDGIIITAKHHDGFCLWPSKMSKHTVAQSNWRNHKGDVLKDLSMACRAEGIGFGVYLSPWDRNHPAYGTPGYNQVFAKMLHEVLTNYGPVFEVWFDGANGEGPNGKKQVYDWPLFIKTVRDCQPNAVIFSDAGPDLRWVGNEDGQGGDPNWNMLKRDEFFPGSPRYPELTNGHEDGNYWVPAECDVSIRPGWFWKANETPKLKTTAQLMDIYYASVGRGASLLLNVPPNDRGLIDDADCKRLAEFNAAIEADHATQVLFQTATAESMEQEQHGTAHMLIRQDDIARGIRWSLPQNKGQITFDFGTEQAIDRAEFAEATKFGQRVRSFHLFAKTPDGWGEIAHGATIGEHRLLRFPAVHTTQLRLDIDDARAAPCFRDAKFFLSVQIKP